MTYIIIQVEDPMDLESISVMPDEKELKVKKLLQKQTMVLMVEVQHIQME